MTANIAWTGSRSGAVRPGWTILRLWYVSLMISALLFSVAPQADILVSSLFFRNGHFLGAGLASLEIIRQATWTAAVAIGLLTLPGTLIALWRGRFLGTGARLWAILLAVYVLGPGIMVNLLLKSHWGRARPADTLFFGGTAGFTPALTPADQCLANCSFVSGEASGATALAIAVWLLSRAIVRSGLRRAIRAGAVAALVVGSTLRIASGRHFLSDVIFAVLIVAGIAFFLLARRRLTSLRGIRLAL